MVRRVDIFGKRVLGLDLGNERVVGVVVDRKPGGGTVRAVEYVPVRLEEEIPAALDELLGRLDTRVHHCTVGLSESNVFIRNLRLPFRDKKKIARVLPLELEEQLLSPAEELVMDFLVGSRQEESSGLLVAAVNPDIVRECLDLLAAHDLDPDLVTLRSLALGTRLLDREDSGKDILVLVADLYAATMVLFKDGTAVFMRYLPYPEHFFEAAPFVLEQGVLNVRNSEDARRCLAEISTAVHRSLAFLRCEHGIESSISRCLLSGSLALDVDMVPDALAQGLGVAVEVADLHARKGLALGDETASWWQPPLFDHALALALTPGVGKRQCLNLRQGALKKKFRLLRSKRQMALAAGLVFMVLAAAFGASLLDYTRLKNQYDSLGRQMNRLYLATFPGTTRIVDPLQQMKVGIRQAETSGVSAPSVAEGKRALDLIADISRRIPQNLEIHVSRLLVDEESIQIKGTTDTFNTVDGIQSRLRESPLYKEVAIMSATADKNKDRIRFQIRLLLAEQG